MDEEQSTGARKKTASEDRTTEEVFLDHLEKRKAGLVEEDIQENYAPDVVQLTCTGIYRGHKGVRDGSCMLKESLPDGKFDYYNVLVDGRSLSSNGKDFQVIRRSGKELIPLLSAGAKSLPKRSITKSRENSSPTMGEAASQEGDGPILVSPPGLLSAERVTCEAFELF
jgi:hypothetical protein